jgi:phosphate uptake regulator
MNKNQENPTLAAVDVELPALEKHLLSLSSLVENIFADAIVALMDGDMSSVREALLEDYKAHQAWLKADSFIIDLLCMEDLTLEQIHFVCGASRIAIDLKQMADLGMRIMGLIHRCPGDRIPAGVCSEILPRMADITQGMFSDCMDAFDRRDAEEAHRLHQTHRELIRLNEDLFDGVNSEFGVQDSELSPEAGTAMILVARCLEDIGQHALDIANSVIRLAGEKEPAIHHQAAALKVED